MSRNSARLRRGSVICVDHVWVQVITAAEPSWIEPFTGLRPAQFRKLVRTVAVRGGAEIADGRRGRQWSLVLADRVLLVAVYWRTNLRTSRRASLAGLHLRGHLVDRDAQVPAVL